MNASATAPAPGTETLHGLVARPVPASDWRVQAAIVLALQVAHLMFESVRTDHVLPFTGPLDWLAYKVDELGRQTTHVFTAVLALQTIERLRAPRPHRTLAAWLAMLVSALVSAAAGSFALPYEPVAVRVSASASAEVYFWYTLWMNAMIGGMALVLIDGLRQRQLAVQQMAQAQEHGRLVRQALATARLQAIQARVDPQLLFDTLAAVKRGYETDTQRAEQMLDALAAFLRAALPRLRSVRSSVELEFGLVQAYVQLLRWCATTPVDLQIRQPEALAGAAFPTGILLPLLVDRSAGARCITLEALAQGPALRVQVNDTRAPAGATLQRLRRSLHDLYGEAARLQMQPLDGGARIDLELPLEPA